MEKLNHAHRPEVPKPMPRTKFLTQSSDPTAERPTTAGGTAMSRQDSKEGKQKGAYSKIKGLFPKAKVKYAEDKYGSDNVNFNSQRVTQEPPNRPKRSKNKYKQSRSLEENTREKVRDENDSTFKSFKNTESVPDNSARAQSGLFDSTNSGGAPALLPLGFSTPNSRPFSNGNHQVRPPGLNVLAHVSTQPKIRNQEQLVEISQRAMESIQEARCASDDAQHNEAAKKYQKSLDFIDAVLETPLGNLRLSPAERNKVEQIVIELKLLRKDALQGFSDAQCAYSLPPGMMDAPTGAPPSYNDVLNEDLLINTQEVLAGVPPLLPVFASSSSSNTPCLSGNLSASTSHSGRNRSQPRPHDAVTDDIVNSHFPASPKTIPNIRQTPKPVFPADVNVKDKKQIGINRSRMNKITVADETSLSDESFASAVSSLSPEKKNEYSKGIHNKNQQNNFMVDPFAFEDPFADYLCENQTANQSIIFSSNETDLSPRKKLTNEVSFLHGTNYHTEVISNGTTNPFQNASFASTADKLKGESANTFRTTNNLRESASMNEKGHVDPFAALQMEARKHFAENCPTSNAAAVEVHSVASKTNTVKPKNALKCETSFSADDSMLNAAVLPVLTSDSYNREKFEKRRRLTKSVINLNDKDNAKKARGTPFSLSRMKTFSRSNESILRMFDPIITDEKSNSQQEKENEEFAAPCLLSGTGRYNPANDIQFGMKTVDEVDDSGVFVKSELNERSNKSSVPTDDSSKTTVSPQPNESLPTIEFERPGSLYPKLSVDEDTFIERPLPPAPAFAPTSGDVGASTAPTSKDKSQVNKPVASSVTAGRGESDMHAKNYGKATKNKKTRHLKEKIVTFRETRTENEKRREDAKVTHGMSAFYQPSQELTPDSADSPATPLAPPRSSSQRPSQQWQEILQLSDAVKLFFLGDAGVSSPFNRQSLLLLRKWGGLEVTGDSARIEVGGELFARDLDDRKTLVMLDEREDYIIQSVTGAFVCMALCSKVKRSHVLSLEKTFDIYATFAKESQMTKLPGSESVSGNSKKHAQEKAPSVSRTTKFVKRNSMRALRKLKGVIVGDVTEPEQELRPEFLPLREAAAKFRTARETKTVRYF